MSTSIRGMWAKLQQQLAPASPVTPAQLHDDRPEVRWRAVRRLNGRRQVQYQPTLFELLADSDPIVRDETVRTLASWGSEYSLHRTRSLLASRPAPILAVSLLDLLARLPDPGNLEAATPYLNDADPAIRAAAAGALGGVGDSGIVMPGDILMPLLADPDPRVRRAACTALGQIGDPSALPLLATARHDPDLLVREMAPRAVAAIEKAEAQRQAKARRGQPASDAQPAPEQSEDAA